MTALIHSSTWKVAARVVNGKWTAFTIHIHSLRFSNQWPLKGLYNTRTHSPTAGGVNHARRQPARQEWLGVRCQGAQGHLDSQLGGAGDRTSNLPVTSQPSLPPEPQAAHVL